MTPAELNRRTAAMREAGNEAGAQAMVRKWNASAEGRRDARRYRESHPNRRPEGGTATDDDPIIPGSQQPNTPEGRAAAHRAVAADRRRQAAARDEPGVSAKTANGRAELRRNQAMKTAESAAPGGKAVPPGYKMVFGKIQRLKGGQ